MTLRYKVTLVKQGINTLLSNLSYLFNRIVQEFFHRSLGTELPYHAQGLKSFAAHLVFGIF